MIYFVDENILFEQYCGSNILLYMSNEKAVSPTDSPSLPCLSFPDIL